MWEYRLGEFFCGAGGLAWGALNARSSSKITHAWAVDYDHSACQTYRRNICPHSPDTVFCRDVRSLDFNELKAVSDINAFAFGFPCNDFSVVGKRKGINGSFGRLYKFGIDALKFFQPDWFIAENVRGLLSSDKKTAQRKIFAEFIDAGYNIFPHLYKFEEYGVPQTRHRLIVVGIRNDIALQFNIPSPITKESSTQISSRQALELPPVDGLSNNE